MSDVDIIINVATQGAKSITDLSASLRSLNKGLVDLNIPLKKLDAHSQAVAKALGMGARSANDHAKTLKGLITNQKALGAETRRIRTEIGAYRAAIGFAGASNKAFADSARKSVAELKAMDRSLRGMRIRAFGSDLRATSTRIQKIGKDAQFVGRSLMINLTAPLTLFARVGFQQLIAVDKELVRLTKVLDNVALSAEQANRKLGPGATPKQVQGLTDAFTSLNNELTKISSNYGVSKQLVVGLASDFAELGLTGHENILALTELTAQIEKLGAMDISGAQDLTQALYFQSVRAYENTGAFKGMTNAIDREALAVKAAATQMQLFNAIENVTALTLKDLGQAFPEVASMAVSFGLSMTEAAALLAPMKAAGLDVGASANSIKVSLQRALSPTTKNIKILNALAESFGEAGDKTSAFATASKTGLTGLQSITEIFDKVMASEAGMEGAMKLMSNLFEKRQGPRMYLAVEQLSLFNKELNSVTRSSTSAEGLLAGVAESALREFNTLNKTALPETVNNFRDIGIIARIATATAGQQVEGFVDAQGKLIDITAQQIKTAKEARKAVADRILLEKQTKGRDVVSEVKTETGRAMIVELAGASNAAEVANAELGESLKALSVVTERLKNNFKLFAADIMKAVVPMLKKLSDKVQELMEKWNNSTQEFRDRVSKVITIIVSFLAALGPVVLAIGTMQAVTGVLGRAIAVFIPKLATETGAFIGLGKAIRGATTSLAAHNAVQNKSYLGAIKNKLFGKVSTQTPAAAIKELTEVSASRFGAGYNPIQRITPTREAKILDEQQFQAFRRLNPKGSRAPIKEQLKIFQESKRISAKIATSGAFSLTPKEAAFQAKNALKIASVPTAMSQGTAAATPIIARKKQIFDRSDLYARKGIMTDADGSKFFSKSGREISEKRAGQLATGQMAGRVGLAKDTAMSGIKNVGVKGKGLGKGFLDALNPVKQYRLAVSGSRGAVAALQAQNALMGLSAPGMFAKARAGVMGFMKGIKLANIAMKILRMTMIASGIGAIILLIGVAIYAVMKNFDKFKEAAKPALDALSQAFFVIKNAAIEVIRPIFDLFAVFGKGAEGGAGAAQGIGAIFAKLAGVIEFVGSVVSSFLTDIVKPVFQAITNIVMFVVSIFKGAWGDAFGYLLAALSFLGKAFINFWKLLYTATISIVTGLAKGIVTLLLKGIVNGLIQGVLLAIRGVINLIGKIPGMGKLMSGLNNAVKGAGGAISSAISSATNGINSVIDAGGNLAKRGVNLIADNINKALDMGTKKGIKQSTGNLLKGKGPIADAGKELGEAGGEAIANAMGDASAEAADKAGKAIKDGIKDAAQKLQDYVRDAFKSALEKMIDATVAAMKKQKEAGLKVFDVQLKTLEKLEKAEESLTKTKEYQQNLRKILDDRDLNRANYIRNRALAIYEGRVDDARMLDLEQQGTEKSSVAEETEVKDSRRKDLAAENLAALREAIAEAKEKAGELFDLQIEAFQKAAADIIKIGPVTIEQYTVMQKELETLANTSSTKMNEDFGTMFENFVTTIGDKMPNKVVGAFSTSLDLLVAEAQSKYGLGSNPSENTIIGVTLGMLTSIGDVMGDGAPAVVEAFGAITTDLRGNFTTAKDLILVDVQDAFLVPFKKAFDEADPTAVFQQAIKDGNLTILRDFENTLELNDALMKKIAGSLDPAILGYIKLKAAADAAADAMENAAGAGGGGAAGGGTGATGSVTNLPNLKGNMSADTYLASLAVKNRAMLPTTIIKQSAAAARAGTATRTARQGYETGGFIPAPTQQGVPAILHGGEYVLNAKAVNRIGLGALEKMNNNLLPKFKKGGRIPGGSADTMERRALGKSNTPAKSPSLTFADGTPALRPLTATEKAKKQTFIGAPGLDTRSPAQKSADARMLSEVTANAKGGSLTGFETLIGLSTRNGITTDQRTGGIKDLLNIPLGLAKIGKEVIVGGIQSFGRTLSGQNLTTYGNFGKTGPGKLERGLRFAEDALNVFGLAQITKPIIAPVQSAVSAKLKQIALREASSKLEQSSGQNFLKIVQEVAGGNTFTGLKNQGVILQQLEKETLEQTGLNLKTLLNETAETLRMKKIVANSIDSVPFQPKSLLGAGGQKNASLTRYAPFSPSSLNLKQRVVSPSFGDASKKFVASYPGFDINDVLYTFGDIGNTFDDPLRLIDNIPFSPLDKVIKNVPSNPYELSGLKFGTAEGRSVALDWHATRASLKSNKSLEALGTSITSLPQIDALLYAGSRGDLTAMTTFQNLARNAQAALQLERIKQNGLEVFDETHPIAYHMDAIKQYNKYVSMPGAIPMHDLLSAGKIDEVLSQLTLVHERPINHPFELGKGGDLFLKPTGDYYNPRKFTYGPKNTLDEVKQRFESVGDGRTFEEFLAHPMVQEMLKAETTVGELYRHTIHASINSVAAGHMSRQQQGGQLLIANLKAVMDANPEAFDIGYIVDTYFTPRGLEGLRIPKGSFEIIDPLKLEDSIPDAMRYRLSQGDYQQDKQLGYKHYIPAIEVYLNDLKQMLVEDAIKRQGGLGLFTSGAHYSTEAQDGLMRVLTRNLNIGTGLHSNHEASQVEKLVRGGPNTQDFSMTLEKMTQMSPNHIARLLTNNRSTYKTDIGITPEMRQMEADALAARNKANVKAKFAQYIEANLQAKKTAFLQARGMGGTAAGVGAVGGVYGLSSNDKVSAASLSEDQRYQSYLRQLRALSDYIARNESGSVKQQYNAWHGGGKSLMMPEMTSMTIDNVIAKANGKAVGKYQQMPKYLLQRAQLAGFSGSDLYSPEIQEAIMSTMLLKKSNYSLGLIDFLNNKQSGDSAVNLIAKHFRSLPGTGGIYYGGGSNPSGFDPERKDLKVKAHLEQLRAYYMPGFKTGGYVPGAPSMPFPAMLHGGEYVINADAVRNMGVATMRNINQSKFRTPSGAPSYQGGGQATTVSTINIHVDTFIGEDEWFKSMMSSYNVNILPRMQKNAGNETRSFTTYNGLNQ